MAGEMVEVADTGEQDVATAGRKPAPIALLTDPATMIAMALLAVALFATPYYLRTTERQLFEGELLMSLCGGLSRPLPPAGRPQDRVPLMYR
jgi:hypothetical protein